MYQQNLNTLPERDTVYQVLVETKRVATEYVTAATEANCQSVRQMFVSLLNDTLQIQSEIYQLMAQQGWYKTTSPVLRHEISKEIQHHQREQQQTQSFVQQRVTTGGVNPSLYTGQQNQPQSFGVTSQYRM